ncbi:pirin-like protein [Acrasis kona]|uniref:Pirin-like protein n=1 Tax=Acrasis kona TaxID=1008807 RepID=A0AAW2ZRA1_9EUKA
MTTRTVRQVVNTVIQKEGAGFYVRRPMPTRSLDNVDPFLMLDHFGPTTYRPGEAKGAPNHPHRGFETVSYILEGTMQHKDSVGNSGLIGPGDVQWMTAGSGIVHDEMPSDEIMKNGGTMEGFQLWVNLPKKHKMIKPKYQEKKASEIPVITPSEGVKVKVIAGTSNSTTAIITTHTPIMYLHFTLDVGKQFTQAIPAEFVSFAYVFRGVGKFGPQHRETKEGQMAVFEVGSDEGVVEFENTGTKPLEFLLLGGKPLNEPIARHGPFVMNTQDEIQQAFMDYYSGRFGKINFE